MTSRLRPIFALLLALLVSGTSSQAKVCELTCGLDVKGAPCRMASASQPEAMEGMPQGHCSPATPASGSASEVAAFSGLHPEACGHVLHAAIENAFAAKGLFADSHSALVQSSSNQIATRRFSALSERHRPPLPSTHNPRVVGLRI